MGGGEGKGSASSSASSVFLLLLLCSIVRDCLVGLGVTALTPRAEDSGFKSRL